MRHHNLGRRQARQLCRRFERVGVNTRPERLQRILAGAPAADRELTDIKFALIADHFNREKQGAKFKRFRRRGTRSLVFAGLVLVMLNFLCCLAYVFLNLAHQAASPW
jgi:hypothetical protein